jgi:micrococcal nuclease
LGILRRLFRALFRPPQRQPPPTPRPPRIVVSFPTPDHTTLSRSGRIRGRAWVVDGDTIIIEQTSIRLAGIDAPELDHPYGLVAKSAMIRLCRGQVIDAVIHDHTSHERLVATCYLPDGRDLSAELVKLGLAIDWRKFSDGKYRHLEQAGVREKLWRCDARQRGQFPPGASYPKIPD